MRADDVAAATGDYAAAGRPMPASRFYELRQMSGLSFRELAGLLGMTGTHAATHLREMADGARRVPGPTGVALQAIAEGWRPGAWPTAEQIDQRIAEAYEFCEDEAGNRKPEVVRQAVSIIFDLASMLRRLTGRGE